MGIVLEKHTHINNCFFTFLNQDAYIIIHGVTENRFMVNVELPPIINAEFKQIASTL